MKPEKRFRTFTVALIGPDGAGKSTISRMLVESLPLPVKHLYMGINIEASNRALPVSRLVEYFRHRRNGMGAKSQSQMQATGQIKSRKATVWNGIWAAGRLANQLAEEWYRQLLTWSYLLRGYIVLYDRFFLFDFSLDDIDSTQASIDKRAHRWILERFYPRPDLVIYLDAPGEVLFRRKREKSVEELERRRQAFLHQSRQFSNFMRIDATQPLSRVFSEVSSSIMIFHAGLQQKPDYRSGTKMPMKPSEALEPQQLSDSRP